MPDLNSQANAVLQEFGGLPTETLLSFEEVKREFLNVRALELQKLGIATTNKTVKEAELSVSARDGEVLMPTGVATMLIAAVEFQATGSTFRDKVDIVQVDDIPNREGSRSIAFYGDPMKYRLSWDSWTWGDLYLFYDPVEDLSIIDGETSITFPPMFWTLLIKKTALNVLNMFRLKLAFHAPNELKEQMPAILAALSGVESALAVQVDEWAGQFRKWVLLDQNQSNYLRRSNIEIMARGVGNTNRQDFSNFE